MRTIKHLLLGLGVALILGGCMHTKTGVSTSQASNYSGLVVDAQGNPVPGAVVERYRSELSGAYQPPKRELKEKTRTDSQGAFRLSSTDPVMLVVVRKTGFAPALRLEGNRIHHDVAERFVLTPPAEIEGLVVDENGNPVANTEVWPTQVTSSSPLREERMNFGILNGKPAQELFGTRTGADGRFRIQGLPIGSGVNLTGSKPGMAMRESPLQVNNMDGAQCHAGDRSVKLVMERSGSIQGRVVVEKTGKPLSGVKLWLSRKQPIRSFNDGWEPIQSGRDGGFQFADMASGTYLIHVDASRNTNSLVDWVSGPVSVVVESGKVSREMQVPVSKGGLLEITVIDQKDRMPLSGAWVSADRAGYEAFGSTSVKGTVLLRLPPGEYHFSAVKGNWSPDQGKAKVEAGRTNYAQIELNPPTQLTGTLLDASGAPATVARVALYPANGSKETRTGQDGRFQLTWNSKEIGSREAHSCLIADDAARNLTIASILNSTTTNLNLRLQPGLTLRGRVTDESGKPISHAKLKLVLYFSELKASWLTSCEKESAQSDEEGRFGFTVVPQGLGYSVNVLAKGYGSAKVEFDPTETRTNQMELAITLKTANQMLEGKVVDEEGKPLAGVSVNTSGEGQPYSAVQTDSNGQFKFSELCAGPIELSAFNAEGFGNASAKVGKTNGFVTITLKKRVGLGGKSK